MNKKMFTTIAIAGLTLANAVTIPNLMSPSEVMANATVCTNPAKGILTDLNGGTTYLNGYYQNTVKIKNNSNDCSYKVGIASYKAYEDYRINVFSQTHYMSKTVILKPNSTWEYTIVIPSCTYQTDVYWGDTIYQFTKPTGTYSGQGRFLDGWYFPGNQQQRDEKWLDCVKPTPTPTPTPTPVVTPTPTPEVTPTPTPEVTPTPTPTPEVTPTPEPTPTPTPEVLSATPTPAPVTELPSTGPGAAFVLAMNGIVFALIGKKLVF